MAQTANEIFAFGNELPYNLEAEQSVLGAILIDSNCIDKVTSLLKPECFYRSAHREIYSIIMRMYLNATPIDVVTVLEMVCSEGVFKADQDAKIYLTELVRVLPTVTNVESYAKIVRDKYYLRKMVETFEGVVSASREGASSPDDLISLAEQGIFEIRQGRDNTDFSRIDDVLKLTIDRLQRMAGDDKSDFVGIPTQFKYLDHITGGLNKSDLLILAARPGMGKTSFALNVAVNVAKQNKTVAIFSLEMSKEQLVERLLSAESFVKSENIKKGELTGEDWEKIVGGTSILSKLPLYLDDTASISVGDMKSKLRRLKKIDFVVIDYLQLMASGSSKNFGNRVQEVSEMTRNLKIMAKELAVPVLVLSQLSRGTESRTDKRPMLSDLRESGSIEQDSDLVMFLYREEYYDKECAEPTMAECIVAKNRHGETNNVKIGWDGQYTKFKNIEFTRDED